MSRLKLSFLLTSSAISVILLSPGCAKQVKKPAYITGDMEQEILYEKSSEKVNERLSLYLQAIYDIRRGRLLEAEKKLEKLISQSRNKNEELGFSPYLELAQLKYRLKKINEASKILDEAEEKAEKEKDFESLYALRLRIGEKEKALSSLEKALERLNSQRIFRLLIIELMKQGEIEKAKEVARRYTEKNTIDPIGFIIYGEILKFTGEIDKAEGNFSKAIELGFITEQLVSELLEIYKENGEVLKAIELSENFIKENDSIIIKRQLVDLLLEAGEPEKAAQYMYEITKEIQEPEILIDFARVLLKAKRASEVIITINQIRDSLEDQDSKDLSTLLKAYALHEMKKYDEALKEFDKINESSKFYDNAIAGKIDVLRETSPDKAIKYGFEIISKVSSPEVIQSIIFALREKENYDSAFQLLNSYAEKFSENKDLLYLKAILHYEVGNIEQAIETADKIFKISPKDPNFLNLKGYMTIEYVIEKKRRNESYHSEMLEEARKLIEEAIKRKPKDPYIIDSLGWYFFAKGDFEKSEEMIKKAYELKPDDPVIMEHLADILLSKNDGEKALELYRTALQKGKPKGYDRIRIERKIKELEAKRGANKK